jgi:hypothetical protein
MRSLVMTRRLRRLEPRASLPPVAPVLTSSLDTCGVRLARQTYGLTTVPRTAQPFWCADESFALVNVLRSASHFWCANETLRVSSTPCVAHPPSPVQSHPWMEVGQQSRSDGTCTRAVVETGPCRLGTRGIDRRMLGLRVECCPGGRLGAVGRGGSRLFGFVTRGRRKAQARTGAYCM